MEDLEEFVFEDMQRKLEALSCPFINDVDSNAIKEMFFKPGDVRMKIFEWIIMSFRNKTCPKFESLNESGSKTSVSKYVLKVFSDLGFCEKDCMDVIQGTASMKRQAIFFNSVLDAVIWNTHSSSCLPSISYETCVDSTVCGQPDVTIEHSNIFRSENVKRSSFNYSAFLGTILESEILPNYFEEVPLDIQNLLEKLVFVKKNSKTSNILRNKELVSQIKRLRNDIERMNSQIEIIDVELKNTPITTYSTNDTNIKLQDTCSRISHSSSLFSIIYANEIQPSCKVQRVNLSELGPACVSLKKAIGRLNDIKQRISQLKSLFEVVQKHNVSIEKLSEIRGTCENPDGWIHDGRVFRMEFIRTLKPLVNWISTLHATKITLSNETMFIGT